MNRKELDALIGLNVDEAEKIVIDAGLKPQTYQVGDGRMMRGLPKNVVELNCENNVIVSAETQDAIDAKYSMISSSRWTL